MMSALLSTRHWTLERAMREWARTDDAVAASVRAADQRVLEPSGRHLCITSSTTRTPNARGVAGRERFLDLMLKR